MKSLKQVYKLYQQKIFFQIVFASISTGLKMWMTVQDRSSIERQQMQRMKTRSFWKLNEITITAA